MAYKESNMLNVEKMHTNSFCPALRQRTHDALQGVSFPSAETCVYGHDIRDYLHDTQESKAVFEAQIKNDIGVLWS